VQVFQLRQWKAELGLLRLSELTPDRIIKAREKLMKRGGKEGPVSNSTVNRYHAALAHALTVAEKQYGWIEINPMRRVPKLKEPQGRVRYLSDKERRALLDACRTSSNPFRLPQRLSQRLKQAGSEMVPDPSRAFGRPFGSSSPRHGSSRRACRWSGGDT
jgi:integrase